MSLLGKLFGRRGNSLPIPAYASARPGKSGWWVLARADDRVLVGPFSTIARAGEVADAISAGSPWRWEATD